jgi:riboflavin synthase
MFTGIIAAVGSVEQLEPRGGDLRLTINTGKLDIADMQLGESVATSGVCLTVVEKSNRSYVADVSVETLSCTTIGDWSVGQQVNLERALRLADRLGGHLVSGHVDGIGEILERRSTARAEQFVVRAPQSLSKYLAFKGSVAVDGISLTLNAVSKDGFELTIVPHTLAETTMTNYKPGTKVNLEVDLVARYLERLQGEELK